MHTSRSWSLRTSLASFGEETTRAGLKPIRREKRGP